MGIVFDVRRYSIYDGPGIRTTVFFKGCPLRCGWCHNPESQSPRIEMILRENLCIRCGACLEACPENAIAQAGERIVTDRARCTSCAVCASVCYAEARQAVGREMSVAEVMAEIERDRAFYDESDGGVTFSGGEPLMQPDFLLELLQACRRREFHTALDTCGLAPWKTLDRVRPYVDLFLYDLKVIDSHKHQQVTGAPNDLILSNLRALSERGHSIVVRVPLIPGVNDDDGSLQQIGAFVASLPQIERLDLLPYHHIGADKYARLGREYPLADVRPLSDARLAEIERLFREYGLALPASF